MRFKLGRVARDEARWAPVLEDYLRPHPVLKQAAGGLEKVADSEDVDRASRVDCWPAYENTVIGDCTFAGIAHGYTAAGVYADRPQVLFSDREVVAAYSRVSGYDPVTGTGDSGCQMQDVLKDQAEHGMTDVAGGRHTVIAYAALGSPSDPLLLSRVLKTFGFAYLGIACPRSAQEQFGTGPWTFVPDSPVEGGHCVSLHRREPYGTAVGVFQVSTWGALQPVTLPFLAHYVEEAWAVITADWLEVNGSSCDGIALAQLEADMKFV